ncbi:fused response regulator/phosphatase [Paracoccus sp. DMF-8]|uniref:PP2C family protein-serine/threonine phosphatase n=1 Tax=Paracoccus sp. DMF-8 TaxID=3019445 RepID=UPI0023E7746A|nr:fused response regulator/phosphatase [Paracoccus sp. DMF-8]MDF3604815.1 fused response regulator/phosphatase [Paracoccus sp. DMF-8]
MSQADRNLPNSPAPPSARLVLLVSDSRAQRRMIAIQLDRAGYHVKEAGSADEAMGFFLREQPDIVISDWIMPGRSGLDLCRDLRAINTGQYSYFMLLTSKYSKDDIAQGFGAGADEFLIKPVSGAELLARLGVAERILKMEQQLRKSNAELQRVIGRLSDAQAAMDRDLKEARALQQRLIREKSEQYGDFQLSSLMRPAGHIGGDMVGFFPINDRRVGIFAADVSGHGITSALLTARLAAQLSDTTDQNIALRITDLGLFDALPPRELVKALNTQLLNELRIDAYFTMIYGELDCLSGRLRLVQAGHPHPFVQRADGRLEKIGNGGLPVGISDHAAFEQITIDLGPGDRIFIASDGITECECPGGQPLGDEGLCAILQTNATLRGNTFLESLSWSVQTYTSGNRIDDMSAVLIERLPAQPG